MQNIREQPRLREPMAGMRRETRGREGSNSSQTMSGKEKCAAASISRRIRCIPRTRLDTRCSPRRLYRQLLSIGESSLEGGEGEPLPWNFNWLPINSSTCIVNRGFTQPRFALLVLRSRCQYDYRSRSLYLQKISNEIWIWYYLLICMNDYLIELSLMFK